VCFGSDGDFSQDWGWADAAGRARISYYPKLAITVPFTPVTGRRFLVADGEDRAACIAALVEGALTLAASEGCSGLQVLFAQPDEMAPLVAAGMAERVSYQYHWHNAGYRTFDEFLARFGSKRRNQIKREHGAAAKQGIAIRTVRGDELGADPRGWARAIHGLHRATIDKLVWGRGWLDLGFYERVLARMPHSLELVEARRDGKLIAGAFNVASPTHLYGRYWGCHEEHPFLHFNVCLYHSIEECIRRGVAHFEGGAGGDHKLARGFEPTRTRSAHLYFDPRLDEAIRRALARENRLLEESLRGWSARQPVLKHPPSDEEPSR
jgi:predicted N-acyltransferase